VPRDCVILGCGRSGTSLTAGLLVSAGYDAGKRLLPPDDANPGGFFEDRGVNDVNEELLRPIVDAFGDFAGRYARPLRPGERWLAVLPPDVLVPTRPQLYAAMRAALSGSPWCRKDPRFSFTLEAWGPLFRGALRVCVFRQPGDAAASIVAHAANGTLGLTRATALDLWHATYRRILDRSAGRGDWLFLAYEDLLDGTGLAGLSTALHVPLDPGFVDRALRRSTGNHDVPAPVAQTYAELLERAG
jgi:hypothetical protein